MDLRSSELSAGHGRYRPPPSARGWRENEATARITGSPSLFEIELRFEGNQMAAGDSRAI